MTKVLSRCTARWQQWKSRNYGRRTSHARRDFGLATRIRIAPDASRFLKRKLMNVRAILELSALTSLIASVVAANLWVWPRLRSMARADSLLVLVAPHMFFRTIGLSFLVP